MRLLLQLDNRVKVLMVDVSVNTEESLQNGLGHRHKVLWERDPYKSQKSNLKICFIIQATGNDGKITSRIYAVEMVTTILE